MNVTKEVVVLVSNYEVYIRTSYVPDINTLKGLERHIDINTYDLTNLLGISLVQDTKTLKNYVQIYFIALFFRWLGDTVRIDCLQERF